MRSTSVLGSWLTAIGLVLTLASACDIGPRPAATATVTVTSTAEASPEPPAEPTTTAGELTWEAVRDRVIPALVRLEVGTCELPSTASGFYIDGNHVVTAAHVVSDATQISVHSQDQAPVGARVVGVEPSADIALLRIDDPRTGEALEWSHEEDPRQGSDLAVFGFPFGTAHPQMTTGVMSGWEDEVDYGDQLLESVFVTNAAVNGGNSGGPVVDRRGDVIGVVSGERNWSDTSEARRPVDGINYVVPASAVRDRVAEWITAEPIEVEQCAGVDDILTDAETEPLPVTVLSDHDMAGTFALALHNHGLAITRGSYATAWEYFTSDQQSKLGGLQSWTEDVRPSYWRHILVKDVMAESQTSMTVATRLRTEDLLSDGWVCTLLTLDYEFVFVEERWLIDRVRAAADSEECQPGGD